MEIIPHRHPFLLIDTIEELVPGVSAVGKKCVTYNEPYFAGHFPQEPVMPGVLIIEALAQTGAVAILSKPENKGKIAYFASINNAKFKNKVVPGDTLLFKVDLLAPLRHGISSMKGYVFVGDHVVSEATFTAQIVKNK